MSQAPRNASWPWAGLHPWRRALPMVLVVLISCAPLPAASLPPLEAYGQLPAVPAMALSPDGRRIAYRQISDEADVVLVRDLQTGELVAGTDVSRNAPELLYFLDERRVVMRVSEVDRAFGTRRMRRYSAALIFDIADSNVRPLLRSTDDLPLQTRLGDIVGLSRAGTEVYMPAFTYDGNGRPVYSLLEVSIDRHRYRVIAEGTSSTIDWFTDASGRALVREDLDDSGDAHRVWVYADGRPRLLYEFVAEEPHMSFPGLTHARDALIGISAAERDDGATYHRISLESGALEAVDVGVRDTDVEQVITDLNRVTHGLSFGGFRPRYHLFDESLDRRIAKIQASLGETSAHLIDWSDDFRDLLFFVTGGWSSGSYLLFREGETKPMLLAHTRPLIPSSEVVPTREIAYEARDGLLIPALLTASGRAEDRLPPPLIVLPHGGPESHDRLEFDWLVQYFASRGYSVLQPQFRGSSGFGTDFRLAGRGEWGRKMSTDLDDGVRKLVEDGLADPRRVCMVGASYGGYASLAAGAFSDFDYRCLVSIAGVSDLKEMLRSARREYGGEHWLAAYWQDQFLSDSDDRSRLDELSPVRFAERFRAPVLLVHGRKDTIVPVSQSAAMQRALKRAGKTVVFHRLRGEDHYLSKAETRLAALEAVSAFVRQHLGGPVAGGAGAAEAAISTGERAGDESGGSQ